MCEHFDKDYDDDIIFFFSPEYGYAEDEEDCDEDNNLQHENKQRD